MYELQTFATIVKRELGRILNTYDKREGSIIYDTLAPLAKELEIVYQKLDYNLQQQSPATADREHLEMYGEIYGLIPVAPTCAILYARLVMDNPATKVSVGTRFTQGDLNFIVIEWVEEETYLVRCEQPGEIGNAAYGLIQPIYNVRGLRRAEITGLSVPGTNVESTDAFRRRYIEHFQTKAFGGNMAQYKEELMKIQGVGGVKIIRHFLERDFWVGVIVVDSRWQKPTEDTIEFIQEIVHPILPEYDEPHIENSGDGFAPIGHVVKVQAVDIKEVAVKMHLEFKGGFDFARCQADIEEAIREYLLSLTRKWADEDYLIVRTSGIEQAVLDVAGIVDVYDTQLNGVTGNLTLTATEIPELTTVEEVN